MRSLLIVGLGFLVGGAANAANVLFNNGLAPPNSANVFDDGTYSSDYVRVRNAGCLVGNDSPCLSPGAPTTVSLVDGGVVGGNFEPMDSSNIIMTGGSVVADINTFQFSTVTITGGSIGQVLQAGGSSTITLSGGSVGSTLESHGTSTLKIIGSDFKVDGVPVTFGDLSALEGVLTGALASGDTLNNFFRRATLATITLIPEPSTALLLASGLVALAAGRRRRG